MDIIVLLSVFYNLGLFDDLILIGYGCCLDFVRCFCSLDDLFLPNLFELLSFLDSGIVVVSSILVMESPFYGVGDAGFKS